MSITSRWFFLVAASLLLTSCSTGMVQKRDVAPQKAEEAKIAVATVTPETRFYFVGGQVNFEGVGRPSYKDGMTVMDAIREY